MDKILFVATVEGHITTFHLPAIKWFQERGFEVHVATNGNLVIPYVAKHHTISIQRNPFRFSNIKACRQLKKIIEENKYIIVHAHTPMGGVCARIACRKERKKKTVMMYSAHGFHFYKGAPFINWAVYYPVERILSYFTDILITTNTEDYALAKHKMHAKKIYNVFGPGLQNEKYCKKAIDKPEKRKELGIPTEAFLLLTVGELNKNKNQQVAIKALKLLPDTIHYCIVGEGSWKEKLQHLTCSLGIEERVHFTGGRTDVNEICKAADIYCVTSFREGMALAGIEGMANGLPIVGSRIRGVMDYLKDGVSGFACSPFIPREFANAIRKLWQDPALAKEIGERNMRLCEPFDVRVIIEQLGAIYAEALNWGNEG